MMQHWIAKFRNALRGVACGIQGQSSFAVHLPIALLVLALAWWLQCVVWQWAILLLCIGSVLAIELMNSAVETLARELCPEQNAQVGRALDIASGAVLVASLTAAVVGALVFVFQWWSLA